MKFAGLPRGTLRGTIVDIDDPEERGRVKVVFDEMNPKIPQVSGAGDWSKEREGEEPDQSHWIDTSPAFKGKQPKGLLKKRVNIVASNGQYQYAVLQDVLFDPQLLADGKKKEEEKEEENKCESGGDSLGGAGDAQSSSDSSGGGGSECPKESEKEEENSPFSQDGGEEEEEEDFKMPDNSSMTRLPYYAFDELPPPCKENRGCMVIEECGPYGYDWLCVCLKRGEEYLWVRHADLSHGHAGGNDTTSFPDSGGDKMQPGKVGAVWDHVFVTTQCEMAKYSGYGTEPRGNPEEDKTQWFPPPMSKAKEPLEPVEPTLTEDEQSNEFIRKEDDFQEEVPASFDPPTGLTVPDPSSVLPFPSFNFNFDYQSMVQSATAFVQQQVQQLVGEQAASLFQDQLQIPEAQQNGAGLEGSETEQESESQTTDPNQAVSQQTSEQNQSSFAKNLAGDFGDIQAYFAAFSAAVQQQIEESEEEEQTNTEEQ